MTKIKEIFYISISCLSFLVMGKYMYNKYVKKNDKNEKINFIDSEDSYYSYNEEEENSEFVYTSNITTESITDVQSSDDMYSVPLTSNSDSEYSDD